MVEEARAKNQDSTFLSEVVEPGTVPNANPGVEVYFTKKVGPDIVDSLTKTINQLGVDAGFTFVTDFRAKNRAAGGENVGEYVGIRMQYIPEFGNGVEGLGAAKKKMYEALNQIAEFDGVSTARYVEYDTQVAFKGDYDAVIAGSLPGDRRASWAGKQSRESGQAADRGEGVLKRSVGGAVLHRRRGGQAADPQGRQTGSLIDAIFALRKVAEEHDIYKPQLAALIRQKTPALTREQASTYANSILNKSVVELSANLRRNPKAMPILSSLTGDIKRMKGEKLMGDLRQALKNQFITG